jgi:hypothetical protein
MNAKWELLSKSKAHADVGKEGLRLELNGGWTIDDGITRKQKAIVEFLCDKDRKGDENLYDPEDKYSDGKDKREEKEDDGKKDGNVEDDGPDSASLQFVSYDADVLRLKWRTKFACEKSKEELDAEKNQHWGFFTWFILMYGSPLSWSSRWRHFTDFVQQCLPINRCLPDLRLMAQLQPIRRSGLGPSSPWRYYPRRSILAQGLDAKSYQHITRGWKQRGLRGRIRGEIRGEVVISRIA